MDMILDRYLAAGLLQHSTSPYANPVVISSQRNLVEFDTRSNHGFLHAHTPLRVARHATGEQRGAWMVRQGH